MELGEIQVVFYCPGTTEKPTHLCTNEANASLEDFLRSAPDLAAPPAAAAPASLSISTDEERGEAANQLQTYDLAALRKKVNGENFRIQVHCETCQTVSILSDELIDEARPAEGAGHVDIHLLLPSPSDQALLDAAKGVVGLSALKSATANAAFVTANLALITALVTSLGLVKAEDIGTALTSSGKKWCLAVAAICGALALVLALFAQVVTFRKIHPANLEEVRTFLNKEIEWRARHSGLSLVFLGIAAGAVAVGFVWILYAPAHASPNGSLSTSLNATTLDVDIDSSWNDAPKQSHMTLMATSRTETPILIDEDTKGGSASITTSFRATRPAGSVNQSMFTITSKLVSDQGQDMPDAIKRQCVTVPVVGAPTASNC